jgi:aspartate/methionine/tyrosine aminotransferase
MLTSPNNPDGKEFPSDVMRLMYEHAKQDGVVFVHDAAYYTPIYVNNQNDMLSKYADAQVFSFSKMYGLSGLRIGYLVVNDDRLYAPACEFVEGSTSGVSVPAQLAALEVEKFFIDNPLLKLQFEDTCRDLMTKSRSHLQNLKLDVLTLMNPDSKGMFAWLKPGPNFNSKASKVHMVDGAIFGEPGMVRMNICLNEKIIKEAVERLNNGRFD